MMSMQGTTADNASITMTPLGASYPDIDNLYPTMYGSATITSNANISNGEIAPELEPEPKPIGHCKLDLDIDNLDELATKWMINKAYAITQSISDLLCHATAAAVGGFASLSLRYVGQVFNAIGTEGGLYCQSLRYYERAHSDCGQYTTLHYYRSDSVHNAFSKMQSLLGNAGKMIACASAMAAASYGFMRLNDYIKRRRVAAKQ